MPQRAMVRGLPWWTWVAPAVLCQAGTQLSLHTSVGPGTALLYLPLPIALTLVQWWGPRVLFGVYVNALLSAPLWGLPRVWSWPLVALPETVIVFVSWLLFTRLARGQCCLPDLRQTVSYLALGVLVPIGIGGLLLQTQLVLLGDLAQQNFLRVTLGDVLADVAANLAVTLPLLAFGTPFLERRGLSLTTGATPLPLLREAYPSRAGVGELTGLAASVLVVAGFYLADLHWFGYGFFACAIWAALRFGFGVALLTNAAIFGVMVAVPLFVEGPAGLMWHKEDDRFHIFTSLTILMTFSSATGRAVSSLYREIAGHRGAVEALRRSDIRFRTLLANSGDCLELVAADGTNLYISPSITRILGYTVEERVGQNSFALLHPDDRETAQASFAQILAQPEEHITTRCRVRHRDGSYRILESISTNRLNDPTIGAIVLVYRDITARTEAEEALRESQRFVERIAAATPSILYVFDIQTRKTVYINREIAMHLGFSAAAIHAMGAEVLPQLMHPEDLSRLPELLGRWQTAPDGQVLESEYRLRDAAGRWHWFLGRDTIFQRDARGRVQQIIGTATDMTARREAEESLRESEELYRLITDNSNDLVSLFDLEGRDVFESPSVRHVLGMEPAEIAGTSVFEGVHPDDQERAQQLFGRVVAGESVETTIRHRHHDGSWRWLESWAKLVERQGRRLVLVVSRDVTARKEVEDALRDSERNYRQLVETSNDLIWSVDVQGRWTFVNRDAAMRILGYEPEEMLGRAFPEFMTAERARKDLETFANVKAGTPVQNYETEFFRKDGTTVCLSFNAITLHDDDGRVIGTTGTAEDITERRRAEAGLLASERKYRQLVELAQEGIWAVDAAARTTFVNPRMAELLGYTVEEMNGQPILRYMDEEWTKVAREHLAPERRGGRSAFELVFRRKDGTTLPTLLSCTPLLDDGGTYMGALAVIADLSERYRLEEQFRQSQKMEAIGRLAGGVAHDFNNLLMAINGYADMLPDFLPVEGPSREWLAEIQGASQRATSLTRQLLAFSRRQVMRPRPCDLNEIIANMEGMLRRLIGETVLQTTQLSADVPTITGDPTQLEQVVLNLAVNARDAMPDGGRLIIETGVVHLTDAERLPVAGMAPGHYAMLAVHDTGHGMDDETISHIFEPFFTTKEVGKGTGLGLATVHGIVRQSGGHIAVTSRVGAGTVFRLYWPAAPRVTAAAGGPDGAPARRGSETVLVVEDDAVVRRLAVLVLRKLGYRVLEASNGSEALRLSADHSGVIDLLISDMVMPEMSGRQLAERLGPTRPDMRVLFLSGYSQEAMERQGHVMPNAAFLQKPVTPDALARMVRQLLDAAPV